MSFQWHYEARHRKVSIVDPVVFFLSKVDKPVVAYDVIKGGALCRKLFLSLVSQFQRFQNYFLCLVTETSKDKIAVLNGIKT